MCIRVHTYRSPKDFASASVKIWPHFAGDIIWVFDKFIVLFDSSRVLSLIKG